MLGKVGDDSMKVGDLVRIATHGSVPPKERRRTGVIVRMVSFEGGKNPQPIILIGGTCQLYGSHVCEVISESR